jgi:putative hydrolase of the HAD superfamily
MQPKPRAIVFDMDDTLYPLSEYRRSGFAAVADHLARTQGCSAARSRRVLAHALTRTPGTELQTLLAAWQLPSHDPSELVRVLRSHRPALHLPALTARVLRALRRGWRVGILTNGPAEVQARKVASLGLESRVDTVVFASVYGSGVGKPEAAPFREVLRRLDVAPGRALFVGDDERCDIEGAQALGLRAVRTTAFAPLAGHTAADVVIASLASLPAVAEALVPQEAQRYAA